MAPAPNHAPATAKARISLALAVALATGCGPAGHGWLTPTPEALPYVLDALAAWGEAGATVGIGPGGAPVSMTDDPPGGNRGATLISADGDVAWVRVWRDAPARTWVHEMGHVLGAPDAPAEAGACIMVSGGTCDEVTAVDLALAGW